MRRLRISIPSLLALIALIDLVIGCAESAVNDEAGPDTGSETLADGETDTDAACSEGCLAPETTLELAAPLLGALLVGDFDGNGVDDLASGNGIVLLRAPDLSFAAPIDLGLGVGQALRFVADIDGDGRSDLVGKHSGDSSLVVVLAAAEGGFEAPELVALASTAPPDGVDLFAEDFDGDGRDEVAVFTDSGQTLSILRREGAGAWSTLQTFDSVSERWVLTGGLVDDDDLVDLVAVAGRYAQVHFGLGDGSFAAPEDFFAGAEGVGVPFASPVDAGLRGIAYTGDVGLLEDLSAGIVVLWSKPEGITGLGFETNWPTEAVAVGDLQGDGLGDVVAATTTYTEAGTAQPALALLCGGPTDYADCGRFDLAQTASMLAMLDLDADGRDDVVYVSPGSEQVLHVLLAVDSKGSL